MNRNYRAQGRSTAHILQLFNKKANKPEVEEEKTLDSQESLDGSHSALSSQKEVTTVINDDKINDS